MTPSSPSRTSARDRILAAAAARFYRDGVASSGIDGIIADAGVAKMSLYNNFGGKTALVAAYLDERQQDLRDRVDRLTADLPSDAAAVERVLAVFDAHLAHAEAEEGFRGCGLMNAAGELASGDPNRALVARHKDEVESMLRQALGAVGSSEDASVDQLVRHLSMLLDGALARAGLDGGTVRLHEAREIAASLLRGRTVHEDR